MVKEALHPRTVAKLFAASALALAVVSCSSGAPGSDPNANPPASGETVTVGCTLQEDWCAAAMTEFSNQTGIQANYLKLNGGEVLARLAAAGGQPDLDVFLGTNIDAHISGYDDGLIEKYVPTNVDEIPEQYRDPEGIWTAIYTGVLGFCSNEEVLSDIGAELPDSWESLTTQPFNKQIAIANPATSGTAYTALWSIVSLNNEDIDTSFDEWSKLDENILQYSKQATAPAQMAGQGEIATGIVFAHDCNQLINEGFNLTPSFPSEGTGYEFGAVSLVKNAPEEESAKTFIDWTLTADAQAIGDTVGAYQTPTNPAAPVTENMVDIEGDGIVLVDYDAVAAANARDGLLKQFTSKFLE